MGGSILDQAYEEKRNAELDAELEDMEADYRRRNPPPEPPKPTAPAAGSEQQPKAPVSPGNGGLEKILAADDRRQKKGAKPYSEGDQLSSLMQGDFGGYYDKSQISREINRLLVERQANGSAVTREDLITLAESNYAQRQAMVAQVQKDIPGLAKSGLAAGASGLMSATGMFAEIVGDEEQAAELYDAARGVEQISKDAVETPENPELAGIYDGLRSFAMAAPAATIAWKTKRPEVMLDFMFGAAAGSANLDAQDPILTAEATDTTPEEFKTLTLGERLTYSVASGLAERLMETLPAHKLYGSAPGKSIVKRFFESLATEIPGEQGTLAAQKFLEWRTLNPTVPVERYYAEYPQEAYRTFVATIVGTVLNNAGVLALDTAEQSLGKGLEALQKPAADGEPDGGAPAPDAAPDAEGATPEPEAPAAAEPEAPAADGEAAPKITIAELADQANEVVEQLAEQFKEPETESPDQKFVRGVESALGIKRPPAPVETPEERRTRQAESQAAEQRTLQDSTQRIVSAVRSFAETRAAAEQTVERAIEAPTPENVAAAVDAHNELAEQTGAEVIDPGPDMTLATVTPEERAVLLEKVAEAVEAAPLPPEDDASATLVEEVRATAPASRYFGRKSFGGEGLATDPSQRETITPANDNPVGVNAAGERLLERADGSRYRLRMDRKDKPEGYPDFGGDLAAVEQPVTKAQPARLPAKPAPISDTQLAAIATKEGKLSRPVQAREAMLLKAEDVYDDVLTKDVLTALDDEFDMTVRQVRDVMSKAIEGQGSLDRFNTLMKRYAKVRAELDRTAGAQVQDDFAALAAAQPDPGEGGLGRGLDSLIEEQGVNPETKFSRNIERFETPGSPEYEAAKAKGLPMDRRSRELRALEQGFNISRTLYHGTGSQISEFDLNKAGSNMDMGWLGRGIYMTTSRGTAENYANMGKNVLGEPNVLPLFVRGKLYKFGPKGKALRGEFYGEKSLPEDIRQDVLDRAGFTYDPNVEPDPMDERRLAQAMTEVLRERGYSGVEASFDFSDDKEVVIFDPSNIRSVHAAFDPDQSASPNLLFSRGARKPIKDTEKNRKRLDAIGYRNWGQNYIDLVQKGQLTFATAEEMVALGYPGDVNAANHRFEDGSVETVINTSVVRPEMLDGILLHEVGVHRGLKGLMGGESAEAVLQSLDRLVESFHSKMTNGMRPTNAELAAKNARLRAERNAARPEHVREETLAYIVEDHVTNPLLPPFLTQMKVAIGRRFPGLIDRLGWGSAEYAQLALVALRRHIIKDLRFMPVSYQPQYRSPRLPYMLQVTYPEGFRQEARRRGSVTRTMGTIERARKSTLPTLWRIVRSIDLRDVANFPQNLKAMERDLTSPEVFEAFFHMDESFDWENYLDLLYNAQAGDPDAAYDLSAILTKLKGVDVPVEVKFSADGIVNDLPGSALWEASRAKGLDMSADARRARGTAAGFNMEETLYHGTNADFVVFDLDRSGDSAGTPGERAVFLSASPTEASVYARNAAVANNGPGAFGQGANIRGANVMPMVVRPGKQLVVTTKTHPELKAQGGVVMLYDASAFADIIADARTQGYDTVRFENVLDSSSYPADQIAVLNPKDIRSINAAFDPDNNASANVMFSADFADPEPPMDPVMEEVYFNFVRFGDPDTVYPTIKEALKSAAVKDRMGPAMVLSQVEKEVEAGNVNAFEAMVKSRKGGTLTPVEMTALRNMHKYSALKLKELADMANADPGDRSLEAAVMRAAMFHQALLAEVKGQSAAASRMLNAMKIQAKATPAIATAVDTMLGDANSTGDLRRMIRDLAQLPPHLIANLNKRVEMSTWKAWQDLAGTWLRAMYLSMPSTHIVNALGNVTTMLGSIADHHVAGRLTMDPDLVEEAMVRYNAMVEGFVHQFTYMKANSQLNPLKPNTSIKFDQEGVSGADRWEGGNDRAMSAARLEKLSGGIVKASPDDPVGKLAELLGYALAAPSEALGVADDLFKGTNYRMSLRGQAFRAAREERRAGKITDAQEAARAEELFQWPTEGMVKQAIFEAQENTFTRPVGKWTKLAMEARGGLNRATGVMGWLLMPFILTPSNLMSFRFRRMPTAPLFEEWRSAYNKGGKDRAVAIAQVVNGTNLLMLGGALFGAGLMTGAGPDDPSKRKALMDTGWKPFAMNVNGTYVETNRLDPLMMPLHISAAMAEVFANNGWNTDPDDGVFELMGMSALKFGQMMTDKTYMAGIANVFEAMQGGRGTSAISNWFNRAVAGATTPALLAGVRRMDDPFKRQAFDIIDQIRNRVPVLSEGLPKAYDVFGNEVMYQEGFMSAAQLFNPFAVSKGRDEPIYQELMRLKYTPEPMDWSISVPYAGNSMNVSLRERPDIYSEMTGLVGGDAEAGIPNFRDALNQLVESEGYQQLSDINDPSIKGSKARAISDLLEDARRVSRKVIVYQRYWPDLQDLAKKQFAGEVEQAKVKEAEDQQTMVTQAYEELLEQAK